MSSRQTRFVAIIFAAMLTVLCAEVSEAAQLRRTAAPPAQSTSTREIAKRSTLALVVVLNLNSNGEVQSLGSGFVFRTGVIATNFHVIDGASRILVRRSGQDESFRASVIRVSDRVDLALLQVDGLAVTPLEIGKDSTVAVGDPVFAVGNPKGLEATFSDGLVSAKRTLDGVAMLQITAPISPGSSGGPILDLQGRVIGVAVGKIEGGDLLNFAIPVSNLLLLEAGTSDENTSTLGGKGGDRRSELGSSLSSLFEEFKGEVEQHGHASISNETVTRNVKVTRIDISGNWLSYEDTMTSPVDTKPICVTEADLLLTKVKKVWVQESGQVGVGILAEDGSIRTKYSHIEFGFRRKAENSVLILVATPEAARRLAAIFESMVEAAKANPSGDVRRRSGPSADSTVEFIRTQLALHGSSKGSWVSSELGTTFSKEVRVQSFAVERGTVTFVTVGRSTGVAGRLAGKSLPESSTRWTFRLVDMSIASATKTEMLGEGVICVSETGDPVTILYDDDTTQRSGSAVIPVDNIDVRTRVIKALNYLIDLAYDQKEPDPF